MSDPEIIKSSSPHRVSIPEGSSNAVGKKAEVGEASIRKVLSDGSDQSNEIITKDKQLKGEVPKLSLDEEIAAAKQALLKSKMLKGAKEGVKSDPSLQAEKASLNVSDELRASTGISLEEELRAAKEAASHYKDLHIEKTAITASGDLRAEKEGVDTTDLKAPKDKIDPDRDLKAPKEAASIAQELMAPKEAAKADSDLRGAKAQVKTDASITLSNNDPLGGQGHSAERKDTAVTESNAAASKDAATAAKANASTQNKEKINEAPDMDFPARVVHLKIENDNLRTTLNKLESAP
jgi:hypothetical protein